MSKFKVGDRVRDPLWRRGEYFEIVEMSGNTAWLSPGYGDEKYPYDIKDTWEIEPTSPIRTVTRREIVPGIYGIVGIADNGDIRLVTSRNPTELREAAALFNEIADVLDEQGEG